MSAAGAMALTGAVLIAVAFVLGAGNAGAYTPSKHVTRAVWTSFVAATICFIVAPWLLVIQ